jgi:hypothetical protein
MRWGLIIFSHARFFTIEITSSILQIYLFHILLTCPLPSSYKMKIKKWVHLNHKPTSTKDKWTSNINGT